MISSGSRVSSTCFAKPASGRRLCLQPLAALDQVRVLDQAVRVSSTVAMETTWASKTSRIWSPTSVVDRLRVELARDRVLDAVDQRQLGIPLPRLVHEPRVLERHAQAAGQRLQQLLVRLAERVLAVDVLERDHARRLAAGDERDEEDRLRPLAAPTTSGSPYRSASRRCSRRSATARGSRARASRSRSGARLRLSRSPRSMMYGKCMSPVASSSVAIVDDLRVEDLPDLVADGVVDRLRVELARDRLLHAVDQRQLGVPLPRLVHQPRVLERHAQAARPASPAAAGRSR